METRLYTDPHADLVERCKLGERRAQYELYKLYSRAMFNVCMRMLNHTAEAEDVLQEAFVDAFNHLHQFRQQSTFGAWFKQIVVNKAITHIRARKTQWVEIEAWQSSNGQAEPSDEMHPVVEEDLYEVERIRHAMQRLPDGYRIVLSLYLFEGFDHEEISQVLGITESTSRTQYMRAKQKLVEIIKK